MADDKGGLLPGGSVDASRGRSWTTFFDSESRWLRVTMAGDGQPDDHRTRIADGVVVGSLRDELHSLWLNPVFSSEAPGHA